MLAWQIWLQVSNTPVSPCAALTYCTARLTHAVPPASTSLHGGNPCLIEQCALPVCCVAKILIPYAVTSLRLALSLMCLVTGELEDSMESFFLSETCKYLYLLQANTSHLPDQYVFTTEGHLLPPFTTASTQPTAVSNKHDAAQRHPFQSACCWFLPDFSMMWLPPSSEGSVQSDGPLPASLGSAASAAVAEKCASLCSSISDADMKHKQRLLQTALPLLPLAAEDAVVLRQDLKPNCSCWVQSKHLQPCYAAGAAVPRQTYCNYDVVGMATVLKW